MDKKVALEIIKLLSQLESWSFSNNSRLPDFMLERLNETVEFLSKEVLK